MYRPRGKESTEVRITQNERKESENSYQKLKTYFNFVSVCVFVCLSTVISSIFGKSFHFPVSYFVCI